MGAEAECRDIHVGERQTAIEAIERASGYRLTILAQWRLKARAAAGDRNPSPVQRRSRRHPAGKAVRARAVEVKQDAKRGREPSCEWRPARQRDCSDTDRARGWRSWLIMSP